MILVKTFLQQYFHRTKKFTPTYSTNIKYVTYCYIHLNTCLYKHTVKVFHRYSSSKLERPWKVIHERCRRISEDGQPGCFVLGRFSNFFDHFYSQDVRRFHQFENLSKSTILSIVLITVIMKLLIALVLNGDIAVKVATKILIQDVMKKLLILKYPNKKQ